MNLFKKKKDKVLSPGQQRKAENIAGHILKAQRKTADYLNTKTAQISGKGWLILLICFCAAFGSYCLLLLVQGFS
ncbi:hypothetical protein SAMN05421820_11149 [Pedobacter steynii]|uniref:Uncharacterized protein n=1 Tax=Pedobacter steynii TaxID=430522 RepID=A0A1H0G5N9_9SPHI|nr:hypothetical protein [Pedobacter steynii]NQX42329.1 hypothetical protein [Pedobacter steynii]SDO02154.1 hypothetical protein SAMN05421820_11149 [Pedobacter steynii]